ncbi:Gfo/Idh/MocA family oxidoreductase [Herbiconiux sp. KACC 21604]|uniref:Gfo/Idh/MocA family protein n=1 Tax=unclassified Herbiconiux TaxID=2618217 RepID=UPI001490C8C1|nr:Gfo/Idh/MocA family oxidoreductase [Herbiconiux sp. SALV-R1]QJU55117.1 Gfo/Idh/MocA family oxidoreductase [Herbiconiux sp. SALV-R1]WPO86265.1 Gfo/Idh/MocA family oxidoreductase [Herbiconiux sp. KACC 21604]
MTTEPFGVGIVGAGPVVQAIHLPTLARLGELFEVRNIMDVDPEVAAAVARRAGARASTSIDELLADERIEVVAICSPSAFHAQQVIAAMRAGKRAVLCEKPFATDRQQAELIAEASRETGVPVIVGAMHTVDPVWLAALAEWDALGHEAHTIRSRVVLPPNARFETSATEVLTARPALGLPDLDDPAVRAQMVFGGVLGLAVHDLPLIRRLLPGVDDLEVVSASALSPWGYEIGFTAHGRLVHAIGALTEQWRPTWELEVVADEARLLLEFPPSYVQAGSATATIATDARTVRFGPSAHNGYEGEWRALHAIAAAGSAAGSAGSGSAAAPSVDALIDDLEFVLTVAAAASETAWREETR